MNSFDAVVCLGLLIAAVTGFNTGLLRSVVTILAYLVAMPIAVSAMSLVAPQIGGKLTSPLMQNSAMFFGIFLVSGMVLGKLARLAIDDTIVRRPASGTGSAARRLAHDRVKREMRI